MSYTLKKLTGLEILDSRGRPTVQATCELKSGAVGSASVPSGASTGSAEALELRDGDPARYAGLGCRKAAHHISAEIHKAFQLRIFNTQAELDHALINLDGTPDKARLGANAILAVSLAFARAAAKQRGVPLYQHFIEMAVGAQHVAPLRLPRLTINLFSGGKHAGGQVSIQDVLLVPHASTIDEGLAQVYAVYQSAAKLVLQKYGMRALSADEGGLAPNFPSAEAMLSDAVEAIRGAGLIPGQHVSLAVDVASTQFFHDGKYHLGAQSLNSTEMIDHLLGWLKQSPIVSIEDGLHEDEWDHWPGLTSQVSAIPIGESCEVLVLGDDFLCTNPARIQRAIAAHAANALLLKVNQIGTLTEAAEARRLAKAAGWQITVSARSGETEDNWLADLAVAWGDQIKVGSITQSERLAKYNRLLQIESETKLPITRWPSPTSTDG